ncbi:hypothetical protein IFM89_021487 [Coptis chinensis]|uniref:Suppressor of forked domain-containing protein n=1 Tax=Coptis chinensis TaxID=261450 RepID=A0A835LF82_9MAGN|nr:hypothetical protein IFM89_021487 [Coptis chinensis]
MEGSDPGDFGGENQEHLNEASTTTEKKKRREKKKAKEEREREIIAAEQRLLEKDIPRTADEFDKLVRSSPNSSFLWIKYMAFMLSLGEIENARAIAKRALATISFREEAEKLNVWVAYFNLENEYGNPPEVKNILSTVLLSVKVGFAKVFSITLQEAVAKVFKEALQYCDREKVHLALLGVYERTDQYKLADELLDQMVKKYKKSCEVWLRRIKSHLKQGKDGIDAIVKDALHKLDKHEHIKFKSQTAILAFKCGVPDTGRSMFELLLRENPNRTDLWNIYLDQEIRLGDEEVIRALFERATSLSLSSKNMKSLFKKYLEYEKGHGDEDRVEYVKRKAIECVENSLA